MYLIHIQIVYNSYRGKDIQLLELKVLSTGWISLRVCK